jgi:hypothetical protein
MSTEKRTVVSLPPGYIALSHAESASFAEVLYVPAAGFTYRRNREPGDLGRQSMGWHEPSSSGEASWFRESTSTISERITRALDPNGSRTEIIITTTEGGEYVLGPDTE